MSSVEVPAGHETVKASIIDTGARVKGETSLFAFFLDPPLPDFSEGEGEGRLYSTWASRQDFQSDAPSVLEYHKDFTFEPPEADVYESAISARSTSNGLRIGGFRAIDWFGDGSFYMLETSGVKHTINHVAALARTTADPPPPRFTLMGGELGHHASQWWPSAHVPLPWKPRPSLPSGPDSSVLNVYRNMCPCDHILREQAAADSLVPDSDTAGTIPFTKIRTRHPCDVEMARRSLQAAEAFDGNERILVVMAHAWTLLGALEYFPRSANR
ncbi:Metallo-hydrolase/oxidoreductase [Apiospora phragmitis]|uniref:Metallo-hydrolase/oxidoreductase n=1 Tax=Apiospora phragmitis TaxID=2905665 RepID=A0ABR1VW51_9PEZI